MIDLGPAYVETSNLAIWLVRWAGRFQKLLMGHRTSASLWYSESGVGSTTLKLTTVNANFLVGCVYLANGNSLEDSAQRKLDVAPEPIEQPQTAAPVPAADDDFTQISNSVSLTAKQRRSSSSKIMESEFSEPSESLSTTLDISSFTDLVKSGQHRRQSSSVVSVSRLAPDGVSLLKSSGHLAQSTLELETMATARTDVTVASARDASEYYNLKDLSGNRSMVGGGRSRSASVDRGCSQLDAEQRVVFPGMFLTCFFN